MRLFRQETLISVDIEHENAIYRFQYNYVLREEQISLKNELLIIKRTERDGQVITRAWNEENPYKDGMGMTLCELKAYAVRYLSERLIPE